MGRKAEGGWWCAANVVVPEVSRTLIKVEAVRRWGFLSCCCRLFDLDPDLLPLFQYNCKQFASPQECLSAPEFLDHIRKVREGLWHGWSAASLEEEALGQWLGTVVCLSGECMGRLLSGGNCRVLLKVPADAIARTKCLQQWGGDENVDLGG